MFLFLFVFFVTYLLKTTNSPRLGALGLSGGMMRFLEHYWWALVLMFVAMVVTWNRTHRGPPA